MNHRIFHGAVVVVLLAGQACLPSNRQTDGTILTTVAQVRRLDPQSLGSHERVRIRGAITWVDGFRSLILQDAEGGGIIVDHPQVSVDLKPGQWIEVDGFAMRAKAYPTISGPKVKLLRTEAVLPEAVRIDGSALTSLQWQYRFVELEGIIRSADAGHGDQMGFDAFAFGKTIRVKVRSVSGSDYGQLVDARVRIRGVLCLNVDAIDQATSDEMEVQSIADFKVLEPARSPAELPKMTVAQIRSGALPPHRIRLHGALEGGGRDYVFSDASGRIPLHPNRFQNLPSSGDLDLVAYADMENYAPVLLEAQRVVDVVDKSAPAPTLNTVKQIQRLSSRELSRGYPATIRGTVTYSDPSVRDTFVQDDTAGIFVFSPTGGTLALKVGQFVEITGFASPGGFAPVIVEPKVRVLGTHPLPKPLPLNMEQVVTGAADSQWVEAEGIVRSAMVEFGHLHLHVVFGTHRFDVFVSDATKVPDWLVNSRVKFSGVCGASTNFRGQLLGLQVSVPGLSFIHRDGAQVADHLPLLKFDQLLQYSSDANFDLRSRTRGTVVYTHPTGPTYLRDAVVGLLIKTHAKADLKVGDFVEAVGTTRLGDFAPFLEDAQLTKIGSVAMPRPILLTADEVISRGDDSQFIGIDGFLVNDSTGAGEQTLILQAGDRLFQAHLQEGKIPALAKGALLRVRGITELQIQPSDQFLFPVGFSILLRSAEDVSVLRNAPWWTAERMLYVITGGLALILAGMAWIAVLRRRVQLQTADLRKAKDSAEQASRTKGEFLANMSHEIRTPMNGVLGMTQLALETNLTDDQREYISVAKQSADALLTVINDILDFSKIEAGKMDLDPIPFALRDKVADDLRTIASRAHEKNLELVYEIDEDIPDSLVGDAGRLRQILLNLVSNAIKFTAQGEVAIRVKMESQTAESVVLHFAVKDTGIGIPPEKQDLVFAAFSQADSSTTRRFGGTGLGLSISKQLVGLMNGRIWLESAVGQGSCFHFTAELKCQEKESGGLEAAAPADFSKLRVLVVDDHPTNRRGLSASLAKRGIVAMTAESGPEALEVLERQDFDLALLDFQMPGMNGFELAKRIREQWPNRDMKMVVLTPIGNMGITRNCLEIGVAGYLSKPIKTSDLFKILAKLTQSGRIAATARKAVEEGQIEKPAKRLRILLAEDNAVNQKVASRMLERLGHSVTLASDGKEAVAAIQRETFDLVLMDVQMPEMDGLEAAQRVRQWEAGKTHVPIIALTAHAMDSHREECQAVGMDSFLTKPIRFESLKLEIERLSEGELVSR